MMQAVVDRRRLLVSIAVLVVLVSTVWVLAASRASAATSGFDDVPDNNTFVADINWLKDAGVTKGCNPPSNTKFCPSAFVTREQMAAFMHRLASVVGTGDGGTGTDPAVLSRLGALEADLTALDGVVDALEAENAALATRLDILEDTVGTLVSENDALKATLAGVSRNGDTLLFEGMNLQVVNGADSTNTSNGLGNVIIGYNEDEPEMGGATAIRTGSHYLIIGEEHSYAAWGGIVAGYSNTADGSYSSVTGGSYNEVSANYASVTGGSGNTASANYASVTGGSSNLASGGWSSVSGGRNGIASGVYASVSGGYGGDATGDSSSVTGGQANTASGNFSSVTGGYSSDAEGVWSSVTGGKDNEVVGDYDTVVGGDNKVNIAWDGAIAIGEGFWDAPDS